MLIKFIKTEWNEDDNCYKYLVLVETTFFSRSLTVSVKSKDCSKKVLLKQQRKLGLAFEGYPKNYIDPSLMSLTPFLNYRFGEGVARIVESRPILRSAICLKGRLETKNVARPKIRRNGNKM